VRNVAATAEIPFQLNDIGSCRDGVAFIAENMSPCLASGHWAHADIEAMLLQVVNRVDVLHGIKPAVVDYSPRIRTFTREEIAASVKDDHDYRRGYTHGYTEAMDDMRAVMEKGGYLRPREAWSILARFHDLVLWPWRAYRNKKYEEPPSFILPQSWSVMRGKVFARDGHACVRCGSAADLQCDHIREVRNGGLPDMDNLRTLCAPCHRARKGDA
jgi:hypothetical protein